MTKSKKGALWSIGTVLAGVLGGPPAVTVVSALHATVDRSEETQVQSQSTAELLSYVMTELVEVKQENQQLKLKLQALEQEKDHVGISER